MDLDLNIWPSNEKMVKMLKPNTEKNNPRCLVFVYTGQIKPQQQTDFISFSVFSKEKREKKNKNKKPFVLETSFSLSSGAEFQMSPNPKGNDDAIRRSSKKPKYSKFTQQELPACKPILTPGWVISTFIVVGVVFIPIGLASLFASQRVVEIVDRYDTECVPQSFGFKKVDFIRRTDTNKTCVRVLNVIKHMKSPVFVYYELDNFYQNHRRYVKSRSDKQLRSRAFEGHTDKCEPEDKTDKGTIVPCGLIAWSMFNDTYGFTVNDKRVEVNKRNIAWKSDKHSKFGSNVYPKNFQSGGLIGGAKLNESIPFCHLHVTVK
ncbi:hypothetical protein AQUCO_00201352v1 [Aquilegia coerulea]|uniref:ALA-interacting subunit n=1 Tax=Aquilegia coerulea TaxID=218851 RepID=A0A2G5F7L5_AQUCA|nr:hypothetical protein AQUCO_00201352v1 [Aquilegia coerulea]